VCVRRWPPVEKATTSRHIVEAIELALRKLSGSILRTACAGKEGRSLPQLCSRKPRLSPGSCSAIQQCDGREKADNKRGSLTGHGPGSRSALSSGLLIVAFLAPGSAVVWQLYAGRQLVSGIGAVNLAGRAVITRPFRDLPRLSGFPRFSSRNTPNLHLSRTPIVVRSSGVIHITAIIPTCSLKRNMITVALRKPAHAKC